VNEKKFDDSGEKEFNREAYFKKVRNDFLNKLGLPTDTKPGQVVKLLEIQKELERLKK
jgi:hypothetical protein